MDRNKFDAWVQVIGLDPRLATAFYTSMTNYPNADVVLNAAAKRQMSASQMLSLLKTQGVYTEGIEAMMLTGRQASQPVSPVFARPPRGASMRPVRKPGAVVIEEETPLQPLPTKKPSFMDRFRKEKAPSDGSEAPKKGVSRTTGIVIMVVLAVVLLAVGYFMFGSRGGSSYDFSYDMNGQPIASEPAPTYDPALGFATQTPELQVQQEVMPVLENPTPLDFVSTPWLKSLQILIFAELLGVLLSVFGDSKFREQWVDSIAALACAVATVFIVVPPAVPVWFAALLLIAMVAIVALVSFMGGRDFSPAAAYFLIVGMVGGLIFNRISLLQGVTHIVSSPVLPMIQIGILFQLQSWALIWFPLTVYAIIITGVFIAFLEGVRPSEDKTYRWGTVVSAVVGLLVYFIFLYPVHLAAWIAYVIAFSASIAISAMSQNERVIRLVTNRWGIRSPFDGAMLVTALLLLIQIFTGTVGLF